jgi:hypothetical protein
VYPGLVRTRLSIELSDGDMMHCPLLLFTSTRDMFVTASKYVTPNYESQGGKKFFYGADCTMCGKSPWAAQQRKPEAEWQ